MYRVTHGEDVYVCHGVELDTETDQIVFNTGQVARTSYYRKIKLKQVTSVNGTSTRFDYAEKSVYVTQPFTITIAEEA